MSSYFIIIGFFFFLSMGAFSNVGPVDSPYGKKAAACEYSSENSADKTASREVNVAGIVANVVGIVETPSRRQQNRKSRSKGGSSRRTR